MGTNLALTIIGSALILVGVIFNAIPKVINEKIMGELPEDAVNISALFRVVLGGFGIAIGTIAMYCRDLPVEYASKVLFSMGSGFIIVIITIISGKFRGFDENVPLPPIILFTLLTILAYSSS